LKNHAINPGSKWWKKVTDVIATIAVKQWLILQG
jgi:hypothetical protein